MCPWPRAGTGRSTAHAAACRCSARCRPCPRVFYGYGFSGNGIATTPVAGRILASLALGETDEWSGCGLVRPVENWLPPEPFKYLGALAVRAAVRRQDRLTLAGRSPGPLTRRLAALAPGGVATTHAA